MKLVWLTDIHLDLIELNSRALFYTSINRIDCDAVLLTGDIAEAPSVGQLLTEMVNHLKKPIYFVLGNHDYYRGKVDQVREFITELMKVQPYLFWLTALPAQLLDSDTVLLGQDGWADGRHGDYKNTQVNLNDSRLIADLFEKNIRGKYRLLEKMQELADKDALLLGDKLRVAIEEYQPKKIIVLTHIPPFREVCFNRGKAMSDSYLPYFVSKATGDVLIDMANKNKQVLFSVLCGHTHERAYYQALDNLEVKVGKAQYCAPSIEMELIL